MTATEFLSQYQKQNAIAEKRRKEYLIAREKVEAIPSSLSTVGMIRPKGYSKGTEDRILKMAAAREAFVDAEYDALLVRDEVFTMVYDIPGIGGTILIERYLNLKVWQQIIDELGKAPSTVYTAHKRALRILQDKLDKQS